MAFWCHIDQSQSQTLFSHWNHYLKKAIEIRLHVKQNILTNAFITVKSRQTTDRPAEIPDDDPRAGILPRGGDDIYLIEQLFRRLKRGIAQNLLQTSFVLLTQTE